MIKLPIVLMEHPTGWKDAVRDAILTRDRLETLAAREPTTSPGTVVSGRAEE